MMFFIGATICTRQEIQCLPNAGFVLKGLYNNCVKDVLGFFGINRVVPQDKKICLTHQPIVRAQWGSKQGEGLWLLALVTGDT